MVTHRIHTMDNPLDNVVCFIVIIILKYYSFSLNE